MKLVLALIVALQVSVCLCDVPQPSKELVDKYEGLKAVFYKRLAHAFEEAKNAIVPFAEGTVTGDKAKEIAEHMKGSSGLQTALKLAAALGKELEPLVDKARLAALGAYEHYLRPTVGDQLDKTINSIKPVLDQWLPADH
ncbi:apolipoprotein A-II [Brachyhypopomus gauderio]|uniref:apolipoprotein A-II n=1 Tax=Brachyhypopomus gauderio TaxID=698409 RepID=UPI00404382D7